MITGSNKRKMELQPQQDPLVETRLIWMRDNQPYLLMEKYLDGTLRDYVVKKVEDATDRYWRMRDRGVDEWTAKEMRLAMLAPAEGMEIEREEVISDEVFEKIVRNVMKRT